MDKAKIPSIKKAQRKKRQRNLSQMGQHYIPRYYLDGFTFQDTNKLWTYVKGENRRFESQPKTVGNENGFYSQEIEKYLANEIEFPATEVLQKIRGRSELSEDERLILATYILTLWKRVPEGLRRFNEAAPQIARELQDRYHNELENLIPQNPDMTDRLQELQQRFAKTLENLGENPPRDIWQQNLYSAQTPKSVVALSKMSWQFLTHDKNPAFLTCDNPVFFFTEIGIGNSKSELTFPISSHLALYANWMPATHTQFRPASTSEIAQINRRTAHNAHKFVFHSLNEEWVAKLTARPRYDIRKL